MKNGSHRLRRGLALATVVSAIAAPAAGAAPIGEPMAGTHAGGTQADSPNDQSYPGSVTALSPPVSSPAPTAEQATAAGDGFDWGDAGIGAGGMLALTAIAGGVALSLGYRRERQSLA